MLEEKRREADRFREETGHVWVVIKYTDMPVKYQIWDAGVLDRYPPQSPFEVVYRSKEEANPFPPLPPEPSTDTAQDRARDAALRDCVRE